MLTTAKNRTSGRPSSEGESRVSSAMLIAHGVWRALSRLPEPALLFSGKQFEVMGLNQAAQAFFEHASTPRLTSLLKASLSKVLIERICLAANSHSGAYVSELAVQLTTGDHQVRTVRVTVLPIAGADAGGPMLAVLYVRPLPEEQQVPDTYAKLPRELLSWLPIPTWLVDADNRVPFHNQACRELPLAASAVDEPTELDLSSMFLEERGAHVPLLEPEVLQAIRATCREAKEGKRIVDGIVATEGQVWRVVHVPITGVDRKPYLLGMALLMYKNVGGELEVDENLGQGGQRKATLRARERERTKLAREVHDSLGQELTVLRLGIDRVFAMLRDELPVTEEHLEQFELLKAQMQQAINSSRLIAFQLRHDLVQSAGLRVALENLVTQFRQRLAIPGQLEVTPGWQDPPSVLSSNIYRSVQELLNNMAKHAQATKFIVRLGHWAADYEVEVVDDGVGIPEQRRIGSLGLKTMLERVQYHNGQMVVKTRPEVEGTSVQLTFFGSPIEMADTSF